MTKGPNSIGSTYSEKKYGGNSLSVAVTPIGVLLSGRQSDQVTQMRRASEYHN
jgi:hypothetical protein